MIKAIVYLSNTGYTQSYAEMAARAAGLPAYPMKEAERQLAWGQEIFYMGWIMQGRVRGYARAARSYAVPGLCGVGMAEPGEDTLREIRMRTGIEDPRIKLFYARGGFDMRRLNGVHQLMMQTVRQGLADREDAEAREAARMMEKGGDYTAFVRISPAVEWIKKYNRRAEPPEERRV